MVEEARVRAAVKSAHIRALKARLREKKSCGGGVSGVVVFEAGGRGQGRSKEGWFAGVTTGGRGGAYSAYNKFYKFVLRRQADSGGYGACP